MLHSIFLDNALSVARQAAAAAAVVIHRYYRGAFSVEVKPDQTPVTIADRQAEAAIKRVLKAAYPAHAFYGEEEGREGDGEFLWLIDPIDGTKSFVRGYPMFSTQIALMHRNELVLGVSCASEFGETAWARAGGGAFLDAASVQVADTLQFGPATAISIGNVKTLACSSGWAVLTDLIPALWAHARLWRFLPLSPFGARQCGFGDRVRCQYPRYRRTRRDRARGRRCIHRSWRARTGSQHDQRPGRYAGAARVGAGAISPQRQMRRKSVAGHGLMRRKAIMARSYGRVAATRTIA